MINPAPVNQRNSPYSPGGNRTSLPRAVPLQPPKRRSWRRTFLMTVICLVVASLTYLVAQYQSFKNNVIVANDGKASAVLQYDFNNKDASQVDSSLFQKVGDGRFNLLILGIGGDNHPGALLTDSIQVLSLDTVNKKISYTSIPRDLYVTIPGHGRSKINATYTYGEQDKTNGGGPLVKQVVSKVISANISNFVVLDFTGAQDVVDALGGVDVNVPTAISDPFFPDDQTVGYSPFYISAGPHHMDGKTALRYARSRETTSDFDRSARQQIILAAVKQKALSLGVLSNPAKVSDLITILGRHMKTDLQVDEIRSFVSLYKDSTQAGTQVLDTSDKLGLLSSTTDPVAGYISYPTLGMSDFSAVQQWFAKNNPDPLLAKENASITLYGTGSATLKQLQAAAANLTDYGFKVIIGNGSVSNNSNSTQIYQRNNDKAITAHYLSNYYNGTTIQKGSPGNSGSDFEIIYVPTIKK